MFSRLLPAALLVVALALPARAAAEAPFPYAWSAGLGLAYPATGLVVGRSLGDAWRVALSGGPFPIPILGYGAAVEAMRAFELGPVYAFVGASVAGLWSNGCSFGGCGGEFWYAGAGPLAGVGLVRHNDWLGLEGFFELGGGALWALTRTPDLEIVQPLVMLRGGVGW